MRVKTAFLAVTLVALSAVACRPGTSEPSPSPEHPVCQFSQGDQPSNPPCVERFEDGSAIVWVPPTREV